MASEARTENLIADAVEKLRRLDDKGCAVALGIIDSMVLADERRSNGEDERFVAERDAMEDRVGVTVEWLCDKLWDLRMRGRVQRYDIAAFGEQNDALTNWRIVSADGSDTGPISFEQSVAEVRRIDDESGSIDPLIAVALETAVAEGWIDRYKHENVDGTAIYGLEALREDGVHEWGGNTAATRGALWAMTVMALREHADDD